MYDRHLKIRVSEIALDSIIKLLLPVFLLFDNYNFFKLAFKFLSLWNKVASDVVPKFFCFGFLFMRF